MNVACVDTVVCVIVAIVGRARKHGKVYVTELGATVFCPGSLFRLYTRENRAWKTVGYMCDTCGAVTWDETAIEARAAKREALLEAAWFDDPDGVIDEPRSSRASSALARRGKRVPDPRRP